MPPTGDVITSRRYRDEGLLERYFGLLSGNSNGNIVNLTTLESNDSVKMWLVSSVTQVQNGLKLT